ncbi:MAG: DUF4403 family protein, partial [Bacteroidia bacterium]|nr:DUF4403 family protein [Bacteroidia bacterium]
KVNDETTNFLNKQNSKASLKERIISLLQKTNGPFQIQKNLFFAPNIHKAFIASIAGETNYINNTLTVKTGVYLSPSIIYSDSTPLIDIHPTYKNNTVDTNTISSITVNGIVSYNLIAMQIQNNLNALIQSKYNKYGFTIGEVKIYPSNEKLAISLELLKKRSNKGYFYFTTIPKFDSSTKVFFLKDVEFTPDSKNELLNVAGWLVNNKIEKFVEDSGKYEATNKLKEAIDILKSFNIKNDFISIHGEFSNLKISDVYIRDNSLELYINASGNLSATVKNNKDNSTIDFGAY